MSANASDPLWTRVRFSDYGATILVSEDVAKFANSSAVYHDCSIPKGFTELLDVVNDGKPDASWSPSPRRQNVR
jgi:hypothetical protein